MLLPGPEAQQLAIYTGVLKSLGVCAVAGLVVHGSARSGEHGAVSTAKSTAA
jgi:chromate transport protein ChrA